MNERFIEIRKAFKMTQTEIGERLGVSRSVIANIEYGRVEPSQMICKLVCKEFNIDEIWLRTGTGEMFKSSANDDEETAAWLGQVLNATGTTKNLLVKNLRHLTDEEWDAIGRIAQKMLQGHEDKEKEPGE